MVATKEEMQGEVRLLLNEDLTKDSLATLGDDITRELGGLRRIFMPTLGTRRLPPPVQPEINELNEKALPLPPPKNSYKLTVSINFRKI